MNNILYNKILLTHDGSILASAALPHAVAIAQSFKAEIILLQVTDGPGKFIPTINSPASTMISQKILDDIAKHEKIAAKHNVTMLKKQLEETGLTKVSTTIVEGDARDEIVSVAKKHSCELIIMSTHGRSGLKRALLGSVADDVVRNAPCPVMLVHPKK